MEINIPYILALVGVVIVIRMEMRANMKARQKQQRRERCEHHD